MKPDLYLLDANVVLRFVLGYPEAQHSKTRSLLEAAERDELRLRLRAVILAECVYVLASFYELDRAEVAAELRRVIILPGIETAQTDVLLAALDHFGRSRLDFADCYLGAIAQATSAGVASFDKDFKRMRDVRTFDWASLSD